MMTSTELKIGLTSSARPSSRVLKPPGGGHSNIFAEPELSVNAPRPKYNQQNSSNLNACMGSVDPNKVVEKMREDHQTVSPKKESSAAATDVGGTGAKSSVTNGNIGGDSSTAANNGNRGGRVPPGGFSSGGFW